MPCRIGNHSQRGSATDAPIGQELGKKGAHRLGRRRRRRAEIYKKDAFQDKGVRAIFL